MSRLKVVITLEWILKKVYIFWGILRCQLMVTDVSKALCAFQVSVTLYTGGHVVTNYESLISCNGGLRKGHLVDMK